MYQNFIAPNLKDSKGKMDEVWYIYIMQLYVTMRISKLQWQVTIWIYIANIILYTRSQHKKST